MHLLSVLSYFSYSSAFFCWLFLTSLNAAQCQGAVENVLERSSFIQLLDGSIVKLNQHSRGLILKSLNEMSTSALRCLGFAYKDDLPEFATYNGDEDHPAHQLLLNPSSYSLIESNLIFAGMAGLRVSCPYVYYVWLYDI